MIMPLPGNGTMVPVVLKKQKHFIMNISCMKLFYILPSDKNAFIDIDLSIFRMKVSYISSLIQRLKPFYV